MIIERKEYLEKLIAWKDKQLIKIVTGVRRCGKSMLLEIYRNYLKEHGIEEEQIISIMRKSVGQRIPEKEIANFQFGELRKSVFIE